MHDIYTYVMVHNYGAVDDLHLIKVGRSIDPEARMADLQVGNPLPLTLWVVIEGDIEKELHAELANFRRGGEWFAVPYRVLDGLLESA